MRNGNHDGQIEMKVLTFVGIVFGISSFLFVVVMWFVRQLIL